MRPLVIVPIGVGVATVSLVGFVLGAKSQIVHLNYFFVVAYVVATLGLHLAAARTMSLPKLTGVACITGLISVVVEQVLGFCCFPGLVKDLEGFGWEHIRTVGVIAVATLVWYSAVAVLTYTVMAAVRRA